jgi:guanylate kinase
MGGGECLLARSEWLPREAFGVVLIGPSGVGKTTLAKGLHDSGLVEVQPTLATRRKRLCERLEPPCDHRFVAPTYFENSDLLITRSIYGFSYGIPRLRRPPDGRRVLLVLKPMFIDELLAIFPRLRIYQIEASADVVFKRMQGREQTPADIARRMGEYEAEMADGRHFAHHIFNNDGPLLPTLRAVTEQIHLDSTLAQTGFASAADNAAMLQ